MTPPVTSVAATTANTRPPSTAIHNTNFLGAASTGIPASSSNCAKAGPSTSQIANLNQKQAGHQIYRAIYNYNPVKADELTLKKNELYIVIEKCQDGWFKGSSVNSLKTGVFPGECVLLCPSEKNTYFMGLQTFVLQATMSSTSKRNLK